MRLCDFEGHEQEQAAAEMGISRGTIQRIMYSGRRKMIDTVMLGKALAVQESEHVVIRRPMRHGRGRRMRRSRQHDNGGHSHVAHLLLSIAVTAVLCEVLSVAQ